MPKVRQSWWLLHTQEVLQVVSKVVHGEPTELTHDS